MSIKLAWQKGDPKYDGLYLVAFRYPNGLGEHDLLRWNGLSWVTLFEEENIPDTYKITGYVTPTDFINVFSDSWPDWDED